MSLNMKRIKKLASKHWKRNHQDNKPSESVSRQPGRDVRDSIRTMEGKCITSTGTFTRLNYSEAIGIRFFSGRGSSRPSSRGSAPLYLGSSLRTPSKNVFPIALILLLGLSILINSDTYATTSSITVSVSSTGPIVMNIPPTKEGKFVSSGFTTIGVTTNHASGYTLTANSTALTYSTNTVDTLPANTAINATTFADTATNTYNNKWGYLPSKYCTGSSISTCVDNTTTNTQYYLPAPLNGQTLDITNNANDNNYTVAIGARLDYTVIQGAYNTDFTFAAVGNPTPYTITYNANDGASGANTTNMPDNHTASDAGSLGEITNLSSNIPHRNGYLFLGWCTTQVADNGTCNSPSTLYNAGATYIIDQTGTIASNTLNLYAVWNSCSGNDAASLLYCKVQAQVKKDGSGNELTQTLADMHVEITEPTSNDPSTDTSNSGVYKYDATLFGVASDAANTMPIYYFRGILDQTYKYSDAPNDEPSGIPSSGDSAYYQNYVLLDQDGNKDTSDTCWRIVRTTGSGGTKMIYNGNWNATDGCARAQGNAEAGSTYFNRGGANTTIAYDKISDEDLYGTRGYIAYVGYNYNDDYKYAGNPSSNSFYTTATLNSTLFKNTNNQGIMTASNLKTTIENWYQNTSNLTNFSSKLETSAGWCNDRTTTASPNENDTTIPYAPGSTYGVSGGVTFGAGQRNYVANKSASLACPNTTGQDLLTTDNGFINYPLAPLTEDEVAFAGHGYPTGSSPYDPTRPTNLSSRWSYRSFLRSGSGFWLLSPDRRDSIAGTVRALRVGSVGYSGNSVVYGSGGVRPAISLNSSTTISGGNGTAANPWVVNSIPTMQSMNSAKLASLMPNIGDTTTLSDVRDGQSYTVAKLADNKYWMTKNLNIAGGTAISCDTTDCDNYTLPDNQGWQSDGRLPESSTAGFGQNNYAYVYNSGNNTTSCTSTEPCYSYYSWDVATLGSGRSIGTEDTDAPYSICPKGWKLPTSGNHEVNDPTGLSGWKRGDFYALATAYGVNLENAYNSSTSTFFNNAGKGTPANFLRAGLYGGGSFNLGGANGYYWSSTSGGNTSVARYLLFGSGYVSSADIGNRYYGFSVRCLFAD